METPALEAVEQDRPVTGQPSRAWNLAFRGLYVLLGMLDPLLRMVWLQSGLGNVIQVTIPGRTSGRPRRTLLGLLSSGGNWYLGHPNGAAQWTRNLDAAGGRLLVGFPLGQMLVPLLLAAARLGLVHSRVGMANDLDGCRRISGMECETETR